MSRQGFEAWLVEAGYAANTVRQNVNRMQRIRRAFGDLELMHQKGEIQSVLEMLRYTTEDARSKRPNPTRIPIIGDLRTGLSVYASTLRLFEKYLSHLPGIDEEGGLAHPSTSLDAELAAVQLDARSVLGASIASSGLNIQRLIAETAWFVPAEAYRCLAKGGCSVWFPQWRKARAGEVSGRRYDDLFVDDGQKAETALHLALFGRLGVTGYSVVHVWPNTEGSNLSYTEIANLALLPRPVAELLVLMPEHRAVLQARALKIFGWRPDPVSQRASQPVQPNLVWPLRRSFPLAKEVIAHRLKVAGAEVIVT